MQEEDLVLRRMDIDVHVVRGNLQGEVHEGWASLHITSNNKILLSHKRKSKQSQQQQTERKQLKTNKLNKVNIY